MEQERVPPGWVDRQKGRLMYLDQVVDSSRSSRVSTTGCLKRTVNRPARFQNAVSDRSQAAHVEVVEDGIMPVGLTTHPRPYASAIRGDQ